MQNIQFMRCAKTAIFSVRLCPVSLKAFGWIWAENITLNTTGFILLLLTAVTLSWNTRAPLPLAAIHAHATTLLASPCFTDEVISWVVPSFLLMHVDFYLICPKDDVPKLFRHIVLSNSNLVFQFFRPTNGLHLVLNHLYLLWWHVP